MSLAQGNNAPTRPRIEPGSPDPESDALTTRPVRSPPALNARLFKTNVDIVELKFGILIAKRLFNGKSISSNLAFMPVANKVGQKVKKFILRLFRKNTTDD